MALELYPWQQKCLHSWEKNDYHGIVNAVTGSGKTRVALAGILRLKESSATKLRVKIVLPGKSLLLQWKRTLEKNLPTEEIVDIGICGSGYTSYSEKKYMLYIINSARYRLARQILNELKEGYTVFLIADECHNYTSDENRKIFEFLPYLPKLPGKYCSLGLSATAAKAGNENLLQSALGKEIYHYSLTEALKKGTVCEFAIWQIAVNFQKEEREEYEELSETLRHIHNELLTISPGLKYCEGASFFAMLREMAGKKDRKEAKQARIYLQLSYKRKRLVHMAKARTSCVFQILKELGLQKQILIFGESITQIEQLYQKLNRLYPFKVGRYHSNMSTLAKQNALERFRNGNLRILLTCRALDEGINVPEATIGIILSGTSMERQRLQRLGRILRKHDGKRMACLYYLFVSDSREEHGYFPQKNEDFQALDLFYNENNGFYFPAYEKAANLFLAELTARKPSDAMYSEILDCLNHGLLREDWLLPPKECHQNATSTSNTREQNYWGCMEQMGRKRQC